MCIFFEILVIMLVYGYNKKNVAAMELLNFALRKRQFVTTDNI
jgi:hypothetical protein